MPKNRKTVRNRFIQIRRVTNADNRPIKPALSFPERNHQSGRKRVQVPFEVAQVKFNRTMPFRENSPER